MSPKPRLGVAFRGMAHCGVPAAAAVDRMAPSNRVVATHLAAGISRFVDRRQDVHGAARVAAEIVPFVGTLPECRHVLRRWMGAVLDMNRRWLNLGMVREIGADEPAIPRPAVFRVARRMDADKTAPRPDVAFKCSLLSVVEDVSGRA